MDDEDFWEDLLPYIRQQVLVPVVGPGLTMVDVGGNEQTFTSLIGDRLVEKYGVTVPPGETTMGDAVAAILRERGQGEVSRLYRVINDIIDRAHPDPCTGLRDLAAIDDLRLFVSTTPDRLLAKAINDVRFCGVEETREIPFAPKLSSEHDSRKNLDAAPNNTVVLSLFGRATSLPYHYAIHEEDRLEWVHTLLSEPTSIPPWLDYRLKENPLLFIGCEIPDWLGRFLLRFSSNNRLSMVSTDSSPFFLAGCTSSREPTLKSFFSTFCPRTRVQHMDMEPTEFVAELRRRWTERQSVLRPPIVTDTPRPAPRDGETIFISYIREDVEAARRVCDAIERLGGDVWFDERRLSPGDDWEDEILSEIRHGIRLFVPIISANTNAADEGYVFAEWTEAERRSNRIPSRRFIVPVVIDEEYDGDLSRYRHTRAFDKKHFGHAPAGEPDPDLIAVLTAEIRGMRPRRTGAA